MLAFEADFVISFLLDWLWEVFFVRFLPLPLLDFFESFDNSITNSATEINYVFIQQTQYSFALNYMNSPKYVKLLTK